MQRVEIALKFIILINIYQVDTLVLLVGIIIGLSAPRTGRLHFGFRSSFDRTTKRTRCRHLFFFFLIAFAIFALLFSLPPSRISDPGSHSRLFSPLTTTTIVPVRERDRYYNELWYTIPHHLQRYHQERSRGTYCTYTRRRGVGPRPARERESTFL